MKTFFLLICALIFLLACSKKDNNNSTKVYKDSYGTIISINTSNWTLLHDSTASLNVSGYSNADRLWITNYINNSFVLDTLKLDSKNNFSVDNVIVIGHPTSSPKAIQAICHIKANKGTDTMILELFSDIKY